MSTAVTYVKGGIRISCDTSVTPKPRVQMAWAVPTFPGTGDSMLQLTLVPVAQTGRTGVKVASTANLPGNASGAWTLFWTSYQGAAPAVLTWRSQAIQWPTCSVFLDEVMPAATVVCYLQRLDGGQTWNYAQATITTPSQAADNLLTPAAKPQVVADYLAILADQPGIDAQAEAAQLVINGDGVTKIGSIVTIDGQVPASPVITSLTGVLVLTLSSPTHYALSGNTLTMVAAPAIGTKIRCACSNDGVGAQRLAYDNAVLALTAYLNTLT